ncbi:MAG: VWA domain-containing protein [Vicinamibacterales bacterium]
MSIRVDHRRTLALLVMVATALTVVRAQQRPPVFRSASDLVEVDAVVIDKSGGVVRGLTRDDFVVTDNGVPQTIAQFSFVDLPAPQAVPAAAQAPSDVVTNQQPADGRLYAIVLDAFHVDPIRSTVVRKLAKQFVETEMGPNDMAAVVQLGPTSLNQPFTSDKALLISAIEQFIGRKPESATLSIMRDAMLRPQAPGAPAEDTESGTRAADARILLESIAQVCQRLGTVQGHRRSVIIFGEGIDYDTSDVIGADPRPGMAGYLKSFDPAKHAGEVLSAESDMLEAARRADVALYTVDPRGNTMGDEEVMQVSGSPTPQTAVPGTSFVREAQRAQGTLRTFASETGGFSVVGTNDYKTGFSRIAQANSSYYVLAYQPPVAGSLGAYHKIEVSVKARDVDVVARKGYFTVAPVPAAAAPAAPTAAPAAAKAPPANAPSDRMRALLASQLPVSGLGLRVTGGAVRPDGDKVLTTLVMEMDTRGVHFDVSNGQLSDNIEMAFAATDAAGKIYASSRSVGDLRVPVAQRSAVANGLRYVAEFALPPGRYQIRAAACESAGGTGGSAILDVDTSDMARAALSLGETLITAGPDQAMPTTGSFQLLHAFLPGPPTAAREFTSRDTVVAFTDATDKGGGSGRDDELTTSVRDATGHEVFRNQTAHDRVDLSPKKNGFGYVSRVPLSAFARGQYVLTIEVRTPGGKTASRQLPFEVK